MDTRAKEIMSTELLTFKVETSMEEALKILLNSRITGAPVVNDKQQLIGIVSEYDIIAQISKKEVLTSDIFKEKIQFSENTFAIDEETTLDKIIEIFVTQKFRRLPVLNKQKKLVGIITRRDLMKVFYYRARLA